MELIDYLRMLMRRWKWVVGCALVGWILGALWATVTPRVYEASVLLFVGSSGVTGTQGEDRDDLSASRFTLERMDSYAALVDSPDVTRTVSEELQLGLEPDDVADVLTATVLENTVVLNVTARGDQPARTANIANAAAARLSEVIELVEAPGTGAASPVNVTVTRPASAPETPISPNVRLLIALGLIAGAGMGLLIAALRDQALSNGTQGSSRRASAASQVRASDGEFLAARADGGGGEHRLDEGVVQDGRRRTDASVPSSVVASSSGEPTSSSSRTGSSRTVSR
ncbi:MAG: Wzz/FepE/Etk N-terminal domain-containing protein [Actinomycetota bacterium]|nr:Wzz/FepE/Etk N-terminal domain-containing protein [Actinomycetota bacterium]